MHIDLFSKVYTLGVSATSLSRKIDPKVRDLFTKTSELIHDIGESCVDIINALIFGYDKAFKHGGEIVNLRDLENSYGFMDFFKSGMHLFVRVECAHMVSLLGLNT